MARKKSETDTQSGVDKNSVKEAVKEILAEEKSPKPRVYAYPEIENENVAVIPFGVNTAAAGIYAQLAKEEKYPLYVPGDFGGATAPNSPTVETHYPYQNGELKIYVKKGAMAMVPKTVRDDFEESISDTEKAKNPMVRDPQGNLVPARLDRKASVQQFVK